jgi:RHS repeat-associated protein
MFSSVSYAVDYCAPTLSELNNTREDLNLRVGKDSENVTFMSGEPESYSFNNPPILTTKTLSSIHIVVCNLNNVLLNDKSISLEVNNKHILNVSSDFLGISNAGTYKLNYVAVYSVVETESCGGDSRQIASYSEIKVSTGIINFYANTTPEFVTSPGDADVEYGASTTLSFNVYDSGGKLNSDLSFTVPSGWSVVKKSCLTSSATRRQCDYTVTHDVTKVSFSTEYNFTAIIEDIFGTPTSKAFTVSPNEPNYPPEITLDNEDDIIGQGSGINLAANAEDANNDSSKWIKSIQWCYSTDGSTSNCKEIKTCTDTNAQTLSCDYNDYTFVSPDVYTLWAVVSDGIVSVTSGSFTVTVDAIPTVTLSSSSQFRLNNTVTFEVEATDDSLNTTLDVFYGPEGIETSEAAIFIESCPSLSCTIQLELDPTIFNTEQYEFYAIATDDFHTASSNSLLKTVYGSYVLEAPSVTADDNLPGTNITISGAYTQFDGEDSEVTKVELWVNESLQDTIEYAVSPFSFNFTLGDVSKYDLQFKLTDDNNEFAKSPSLSYDVEENPPSETPIVTYDNGMSSNISTTGAINLSVTAVANASIYKWYEYSSCPVSEDDASAVGSNISNTLASNQNITINKQYAGNGSYCYCAQAFNPNGNGPIGFGTSSCAEVSVEIPDDDIGYARFSANLSLTQSQSYKLEWQTDSASAVTFILQSKQGQPGSSNVWEDLELTSDQALYFDVDSMSSGDVSYKITSCNQNGDCLDGQIITINHQAPYVHKAEYISDESSEGPLIKFEGLGLEGLTEANIQIRNTAESFTYDVTQGDDSTQFEFTPDDVIITGIENGGLRLSVTTLLGQATIEFDESGSSTRVDIDLINASPTISDQGVIYVSSGQSVYAFDTGGFNQAGWPFTLDSTTSEEVEISAAPTLDADDNNQDLIYIGATNRYVYKLDYQANIQWQTRLRGEIHAKAQLLSQEDTFNDDEDAELLKLLYVGVVANDETSDNDISGLYALNVDTGAERFMYPLLAGVKQEPQIFANGDLHVTTEDDQLHIINRQDLGANALRWEDIDGSLIQESLSQIVDWEIPEDADVPLHTLTGLFYGLLGRSPTQAELSFFAYAYWNGVTTDEITAAFLGSDQGLERFPVPSIETTESATVFIDSLFSYLFPSEPDKDSAGGLTKIQWSTQLLTGIPRSQVAYDLVQTDDYTAYSSSAVDIVINIFYDHCTDVDTSCKDNTDSDNDGYTDAAEVELGTNPFDPTDLVFGPPTLTASESESGEFSLSWDSIEAPNELHSMYYKVAESVNGQPDVILPDNTYDTEHDLVKAAGHYEYKVQACLNEQICSDWSNTALVDVSGSVAATTVQPLRAPQYAAEVVLPTENEINTSAEFGVTAGQFKVNESGAATYSLPFDLPNGIAGVKPEFGLAYSSQSSEGLAGLGWNLQGLSAITRCANSKLLDGYNKPVSYDDTDHFCFNGQRLLLKTGEQGQANSTYVTELDSQQIITYLSNDSFTVEGKDKSLVVYGATDNAKVLLTVNEELVTHSWLVSYSQDNLRSLKNQIDYIYTEQDELLEKVISEVTYSDNRLLFKYASSSDRIKSSGYIQGIKIAQRATLSGVNIYNHYDSDNPIKSYNFELEENDIGQQTLTSIQECAYASTDEVCKAPVEFDYNDVFTQDQNDISFRDTVKTPDGKYLRSVMVLDTNNDGVNDLVTLTQVTNKEARLCVGTLDYAHRSCRRFDTSSDLQSSVRLVPTDPDGDGLMTFLVNTDNNQSDGEWIQFDVSESGFLSEDTVPLSNDDSMGVNIKTMDFNGDGYNDLFETQPEGTSSYPVYVRLWDSTLQSYTAPEGIRLNSYATNVELSSNWQSIDVNQDGLSDIMMWGDDEESLYFYTINPDITEIYDTGCLDDIGLSEGSAGSEYCLDFSYYNVNLYQEINVKGKHATPVDFNSDGLTDIVVYNTSSKRWNYYLNNGNKFIKGWDFDNNSDLSSSVAPIVVDMDADGRLELVFHDKTDSKWYRYEWTHLDEKYSYQVQHTDDSACAEPGQEVNKTQTTNNKTDQDLCTHIYYTNETAIRWGFTRIEQPMSDWTFSPPTDDPDDNSYDSDIVEYGMFADADNDGLLDFLYKESRIEGYASTSINLYHGGNREKHPGLLKTITTGTGLKTNIDYGSMADTGEEGDVYTPDTGVPEGITRQALIFRVLNSASGGPLVKSVSNDIPVGNDLDSVSIDYHYNGARAQFGRGNLGFESISTTTEKDGVSFITTTTYSQVFPYLGMPLKTEKIANDGSNSELISIAENRYTHQSTTLDSAYTSYLVYQQESRDCQANLNLDSNSPSSVDISSYSCQQMLTEQDAYANVTSTQTGHYNVYMYRAESFVNMTYSVTGELLKSSTSTNTYGTGGEEEETEKRFGRLSKTVVVHNKGDLSQTRVSEFVYNSNGMLSQEIVEPDGDCTIKRVTEHTYDDYGNSTGTIVSNGTDCTDDDAVSSSSSKVYDGDDRYVKKTIKNGITTSEDAGRNTLGQVISAKNTDGVQTSFRFDAFGTKYSSFNPSGAQSTKLNKACETYTYNCYTVVVKTANGIELAKEYVNTAGQVYKKSSLDAFGNWHDTYQTYDKYGRVTTSITQGTDGSEKVSHSTYDVFDRVITTFDVSTGLTAKKDIVGFVHTSTLNGDIPDDTQTNITTYNALGEQKSVEDTLGNILTYTYGINGGLTSVHSSVDDTILSTIEYDKLGRKTKMIDKERGVWLYEYNALGQLVQQTDARGVITNLVYDDLGRKTEKVVTGIDSGTDTGNVPSETMEWEYGSSAKDKHRLLKESIGTWSRHFYYDNLGRAVATLTNLDNTTDCAAHVTFNTIENDLRITDDSLSDPIASRCVIQQTFFDEYGRTFQQFDDYRRNKDGTYVDVRGVRQHYQNNQVVKQQEAREGNDGRVYHEIVSLNEFGLVTSYNKGAQRMSLDYDEANRLVSTQSSSEHIQADYYGYDSIGNVTDRLFKGMDTQEFSYDALNRVTHVDGIQLYHYDDNGSITEKDGWTLEYAGTGSGESTSNTDGTNSTDGSPLHGVTSRSKSGEATETYGYDANGNQIWGRKDAVDWRTFTYSGRNKATSITVGDKTTTFSYDANNKRFKRTDSEGTIFYVGSLELTIKDAVSAGVDEDGKEEFNKELYIKRYLGEAMQTYYVNGNSMLRWLYKDNLGSVIAIANDSGKLVKRFKYDVFGQQTEILPTQQERELYYELTFASVLGLAEISNNTRGYTGHEPVFFDNGGDDDKRIIHMNGRMYDASLGRMLQADPVVQAPNNLQNYNAYTYVLNNPLNMTDPSGYFFKKLLKAHMKLTGSWAVHKFLNKNPLLKSIVSVALNFIPGCQAWCSAVFNGQSTFVATGSLNAGLKAGAISYLSSEANGLVGGNTDVGSFGNVFGNAMVGGISAELQGGNFGHGFWAAGFAAMAKPMLNDIGGDNSANSAIARGDVAALSEFKIHRVVGAAVVGGTASVLSGGKFANGAVTGAFTQLYNGEVTSEQSAIKSKYKMVFRALSEGQRKSFDNGLGIFAPNRSGTLSPEEHVGGGSIYGGESQWISTTTQKLVTDGYESGHGVVIIDLTKVPSKVVSFNTIGEGWAAGNTITKLAYIRSVWAQEVLVKGHIPQKAMTMMYDPKK